VAGREHDLNGADGVVISGAATASTGHYQPRATDGVPQSAEPYQGDDDDDIGPVTSPNLLVGRVTLTEDAQESSNTPVVVRDYRPPADEQPDGFIGTADGLLSEDEAEDFRGRWPGIKATFVDDPVDSIRQADMLLREVTELVMRRLHDERARLGSLWESQEDTTTEDLRLALRGYQGFFDQLADAPERIRD
jgi:hypothetical protein